MLSKLTSEFKPKKPYALEKEFQTNYLKYLRDN